MNLIELIRRKDRPLEKSLIELLGDISVCNYNCDGFRMRGVRMPPGSSIRLRGFLTYSEFKYELPRDLGWAVSREKRFLSKPRPTSLVCSVLLSDENKIEVARQILEDDHARWWPLHFDWPLSIKEFPDAALLIEVVSPKLDGSSDAVVVGITEHFDLRKAIFHYTKGRGIEIGPGMSPQVLPSRDVEVKYLERSPIQDWERLYNSSGKYTVSECQRKLIPYYIIGNAQKLDVIEDESLDFIFSSHVFEHFTNPLGTLEIWQQKLRPGGHVVGVVPEAHNCFDILQPLSSDEEWLEEWTKGIWDYETYHYEKWCRFSQPWASVEHLKKTGFAIHAHYYAPRTFGRLLDLAVQRLGYSNFHIRGTRNHKDFGFVLQK